MQALASLAALPDETWEALARTTETPFLTHLLSLQHLLHFGNLEEKLSSQS